MDSTQDDDTDAETLADVTQWLGRICFALWVVIALLVLLVFRV